MTTRTTDAAGGTGPCSTGEVWVIIPARGGSKGIPGKNLQLVGGRSLLGRSIEAALAATAPTVVAVTTDDDVIADEAARYGATVVRRPDDLATDESSSEAAMLNAIDQLSTSHPAADIVVLVQCTSPFVTADDIDGVIDLVAAGHDSAFTATPSHGFLWQADGDTMVGLNHDAAGRLRRQDRPVEHLEVGSAYAMRAEGFAQHRHRFFGRVGIHPVSASRGIEIDEPDDLRQARALAPLHDRWDTIDCLPARVAALVLDFDGVLTDNRVITLQDGTEAVTASRGDGMGIELLTAAGIPVIVLSKERNPVVAARCAKLGIPVVQGLDDKVAALRSWCDEQDVVLSSVVFVGNDINDQECLRAAGCGVVVADAHDSVIDDATIVLQSPGGYGAVREICDLILERNAAR